jgi:outer membrane protein, multidrug efflux system
MKLSQLNNILILVVAIFMAIACKSTKSAEKKNIENIPASFVSKTDSTKTLNLKWNDFFKDSNLISLIDISVDNNLDALMALQKIEVANANVRFRKGALFPDLNLNVSASQRKFGLYTMDGAGNISTEMTPGQIVPIHLPDYYLGLQTSWEIDVWGKLRNKKKAAIARYLSSIQGKNMVITNLIANVASAYYSLLALDNELDIIKETINLQENAFKIVSVQKQAGVASELAVEQFEAQLLNSKALEYDVLQKIQEYENKINFLLGRYSQKVVRGQSILKQNLPININAGIPSDLLRNRPDIKEAELELLASKADVKAAKAAFYPTLNITGGLGMQAFKTTFLFTSPESMAYSLIGNLMAPLINRRAIKAEFRTSHAVQQQALYNYQKTIINGYFEVNNQLANISNMEKKYDLKKSEVAVLSKAIETSTNLFKSGRATYIEVLMTQKNALQSKLELVNTRQNQFNATVDIYKALGGGWK